MTAPAVRIIAGDMLVELPKLIASGVKVHAIVTDPPYHLQSIVRRFGNTSKTDATDTSARARAGADGYARLSTGFMGKTWDGGDIAFRPETWRLCYDLLPPGGHLLAFAGTRTYHRIACAIEDAGFEIRDMLAWLYGSGFPKSHNVGKAIDKAAGIAGKFGEHKSPRHAAPRHYPDGMARPCHTDDGAVDRNGREYLPATDAARAWEGWGTALKPALEPLCVARKPLDGTVAGNVLAHGTGALNIDACRVGTGQVVPGGGKSRRGNGGVYGDGESPSASDPHTLGRWPANVAHDGSAEVVDAFPNVASGTKNGGAYARGEGVHGGGQRHDGASSFGDSGNAARFFYSSKADAADRLASKHPTVKPVDLVQWLVRLVTPPGGTVLDPFAGSGTTAMACMAEGFDCIVVEREAEYVADIRRRVAHVHGTDTPLFGGAK